MSICKVNSTRFKKGGVAVTVCRQTWWLLLSGLKSRSSALLNTPIECIFQIRCPLIASKCQVLQLEQSSTDSGELIGIGTWSFSRSLIYMRLRSVVTQIYSLRWQVLYGKSALEAVPFCWMVCVPQNQRTAANCAGFRS